MSRRRITRLAAALVLLLRMTGAMGADECKTLSEDCVAVGGWNFSVGFGAGVRTNPLAHSLDIPLIVIPQVSYYGKRFFLDNLDMGFTLAERGAHTLSLIASPGYDRVFFYRADPQNLFAVRLPGGGTAQPPLSAFPARSRGITYLAGPEWTYAAGRMTGQLDYLHDLTGRDRGNEIRAALDIVLGEWVGSWRGGIGLTWKSASIVNYYYGEPGFHSADALGPIANAGAALDPFVKLAYSRPLNRKWKLTALVNYERLGNAIAASPIVAQRHVTTAFIGATYVFRK